MRAGVRSSIVRVYFLSCIERRKKKIENHKLSGRKWSEHLKAIDNYLCHHLTLLLSSHTALSKYCMEELCLKHKLKMRNTDLRLTPWASRCSALHFTVLQRVIGNVWDKLLRSKGDQTDSKGMKKKVIVVVFTVCTQPAWIYLSWKKLTNKSDQIKDFLWSHFHLSLSRNH